MILALFLLFVVATIVFLTLYTLTYNDKQDLQNQLSQTQAQLKATTEAQARSAATPSLTPTPNPRPLVARMYDALTGMSQIATLSGYTSFNPFDRIDRIYYINMDHRTDRNVQMINELLRMGVPADKVQRVPGVKDRFGALGCSKAHLNALLDCQAHHYQNCLILEDDFTFKYNREFTWEQLNRFYALNIEWDVVMWASNTLGWQPTTYDLLVRILDAQTTSGYMVNRAFLPTLIDNVRQGINLLEVATGEAHAEACIDIYWKRLQPTHQWYAFHPIIGHQRDGLSDIMGQVTSYADKRELFDGPGPAFDYLICVKNCQARLGRNPERSQDLQTLCQQHPTVAYYQYVGDPHLPTDFSVNEHDHIITLRCQDDYLNLCHKFGQLLHALRNILSLNKRFHNLRGVFFTDDDIVLTVPRWYDFVHDHDQLPYWGHVAHHDALTTHLAHKARESELVRQQVAAYPDLLKYPIEVTAGDYCPGGGFFLRTDVMLSVSDSDDLFAPFPADQATLDQYKLITPEGDTHYSSAVCVIDDLNVGTAVTRLGYTPTQVDIHQIAQW